MASVTSETSDKANGLVDKPASKEVDSLQPVPARDGIDINKEEEPTGEEDEEEEDQDEDADDEEERQMVGDDEDDDEDLEEGGEEQEGQGKSQSLTQLLLNDPEGQLDDNDEDEFDEEIDDVYIPPAAEPISRKRSHQEVAEDEDEPDNKKAKA